MLIWLHDSLIEKKTFKKVTYIIFAQVTYWTAL
jgi:hypothetical protein